MEDTIQPSRRWTQEALRVLLDQRQIEQVLGYHGLGSYRLGCGGSLRAA
jgi:hypothetical protein